MTLDANTLDAVLNAHFDMPTTNILGKEPERADLLKFVRGGMATKRLRKKFLKNPDRYAKRINRNIWREWEIKRYWKIVKVLGECIRGTMSQPSFASLIFPTMNQENAQDER
jgi:hypothetical protein